MDCYSSSIDSILEEEDLVVDQLKEYYYFGAAVGDLCNRHQMAQFGLERAESHLALQRFAKERHDGNDPNVLTKLWGKWSSAGETLEERQAKARALDQNIDEAQRQIQRARAGVDEFAGLAQLEMKRFHARKDRDLKESLANYVMLQLKLLKTVILTTDAPLAMTIARRQIDERGTSWTSVHLFFILWFSFKFSKICSQVHYLFLTEPRIKPSTVKNDCYLIWTHSIWSISLHSLSHIWK